MTIDFRAEVDKRKDALMEDLFGLLRINSERDDSKVDDKHPFVLLNFLAMKIFLKCFDNVLIFITNT